MTRKTSPFGTETASLGGRRCAAARRTRAYRRRNDIILSKIRHLNPVHGAFAGILAGVGLLTVAASASPDAEWQPPASLAETAADFVRSQLPAQRGNTTVAARPVDPRIKLRACASRLEAFLPPGGGVRQTTSVGVRCAGPVAWKLYVQVSIQTRVEVARLTRTLPPKHRISASDIEWVEQIQTPGSIALIRGDQDPVGRVLRTTAGAGQTLSSAMLEPAWLIRRGERVTLAAGGRGLAIRMQGIALSDGALGQKIQAKNAKSGNTVEGVVRERGLLEIVLY